MNAETNTAKVLPRLSAELNIPAGQVAAVAKLLKEGNTIPFIARYRKEVHGNLDEVQISKIQERLTYYAELEDRRATILKSIDEQGKLTDELREKIESCMVKAALEDLYQPYKPKRRTRAMIAKEKGLEPLADAIWNNDLGAADFQSASAEDLQGARDILAERIADMAEVRGFVRETFAKKAVVKSEVVSPKPTQPTKFEQYYDFEEPIAEIPSHRYLAICRGQKEGVLWRKFVVDPEPVLARIEEIVGRGGSEQLRLAIADAYKRLLAPSCEIDVATEKKMEADRAAVDVFAENLRHLLLASPLGEKRVLAIDPGIRTGCKVAMLDETGKFLVNEHRDLPRAAHGRGTGGPCAPRGEVPPRRDRRGQRHGRARDGGVRAERAEADRREGRDGGERERGWRERVLRERDGTRRVPGSRPHRARRDLHRTPPAGPARRAREDRAEGDRRGAVPARRVPAALGG